MIVKVFEDLESFIVFVDYFGFVCDWMLIGLFFNEEGVGFECDYLFELIVLVVDFEKVMVE